MILNKELTSKLEATDSEIDCLTRSNSKSSKDLELAQVTIRKRREVKCDVNNHIEVSREMGDCVNIDTHQQSEGSSTSVKESLMPTQDRNTHKLLHENNPGNYKAYMDVRSPHILSMMEVHEEFVYESQKQTIGEIAYHMKKIKHTTGDDSPLLAEIYNMTDGKKAKVKVRESLRYSSSWQEVKVMELRSVVRAMLQQDTEFRNVLEVTGTKTIRHTVPDKFWGTCEGSNTNGRDMYRKILMEERELIGGRKEEGNKQDPYSLIITRDTEIIIIADSQGKHINRRFMFGKGKSYVKHCTTVSEMNRFMAELGSNRPKVQNILINNGINDIREDKDVGLLVEEQWNCISRLKEICPNANIQYSMPLTRDHNRKVDTLGSNMWKWCIEGDVTFVQHNLQKHNFQDDVNITSEATRIYVRNLHSNMQHISVLEKNQHVQVVPNHQGRTGQNYHGCPGPHYHGRSGPNRSPHNNQGYSHGRPRWPRATLEEVTKTFTCTAPTDMMLYYADRNVKLQ